MQFEDFLHLLTSGTPVPTILVVGGIFFLFLSVVQSAGASVIPNPKRQGFTMFLGVLLLVVGIGLYLVPFVPSPAPQPTAITSPVASSSLTPTLVASSVAPIMPTAILRPPTPAGKIASLLQSSTAPQDPLNFKAELTSLGFDIADNLIYGSADWDASTQQEQAEAALANGAKVLVLDPVNLAVAAAIADAAHAKNVPVISYAALITGSTGVNYYIDFDSVQVGKLQATALTTALSGVAHPTIVMIYGDPNDQHTVNIKKGAHSVFDPLVSAGKLTIAKEYDTPNWDPAPAQLEMTQALTALNNKVDGVFVANDGMAGGALIAMKAAGLTTFPPMTGQDATIDGIQRILTGEQYMTAFRDIKSQADTAAQVAYDLATGAAVPSTMLTGTTNNGSIDVPTILLTPVAVTKGNIESTVIADSFLQVSDICTPNFAAACAAADIK